MIKLEQGLRVHSFSFYVLLNYSNLNSKCFQKKLFQDVTKKILTGIIFHRWTKQKKQRLQQQLVNISTGCTFLNNKYVFCVKKRNALFGHFSLKNRINLPKKPFSDSMS